MTPDRKGGSSAPATEQRVPFPCRAWARPRGQGRSENRLRKEQRAGANWRADGMGARKIGYARVSDDEQEEALQIAALKAAGCERVVTDHGARGTKKNRKGLRRVLKALERGDELVIWKIDRLGRSNEHLSALLTKLRGRGIDLVSLTQGVDISTSAGRMLYGVLAVVAEYETEQISERTRAGMEVVRAQGRHIGRLPNAMIRDAHARLARGEALPSLAEELGVSVEALLKGFRRLALDAR